MGQRPPHGLERVVRQADVARGDDDLRQILELQRANLAATLGPERAARDGFVTLTHDLDLLREMGARWPHIIGRAAGRVVAYALVSPIAFRPRLPELEQMFRHLEQASFEGRPLRQLRYYVMGQLCVDREHRGQGWVEALYTGHRQRMAADFDLAVTDVDAANGRSLRVHERTGWTEVERYVEGEKEWVVIGLRLGREGEG